MMDCLVFMQEFERECNKYEEENKAYLVSTAGAEEIYKQVHIDADDPKQLNPIALAAHIYKDFYTITTYTFKFASTPICFILKYNKIYARYMMEHNIMNDSFYYRIDIGFKGILKSYYSGS